MSVQHYENFPVASWLCPPTLRPAIRAIYAYARTADDIADEGDASREQRLNDLASYRHGLRAALSGSDPGGPWRAVFTALVPHVAQHRLPQALFEDLIEAFEQDIRNPRYADRAALLDYCRRSANPIGRLLLHLYRIDDPRVIAQSDALCSGLQLINFWQDLSVDVPRGRQYVPLDALARHGLGADRLPTEAQPSALAALVVELCDWAAELMHAGAPVVHALPGRIGWEARAVVQGGLRVLEKTRRLKHQAFRIRPRLHPLDAPLMLWRAVRMSPQLSTREPAA